MSVAEIKPKRVETATLGGGCFWCTKTVFQLIRGVIKVDPGYTGGDLPNPFLRASFIGNNGHVEVANIAFDPDAITFREILEIFFGTHDPTQLNRQGADVGTQYRSVVFYRTQEQKATAEQVIADLTNEEVYDMPIVTAIGR